MRWDHWTRCPRCGEMVEPPHFPALSRTNNRSYICAPCGYDEGLKAHFGTLERRSAWPVERTWHPDEEAV